MTRQELAEHRAYLRQSVELWSRATSLTPKAFVAAMDRAERAARYEDWAAVVFFLRAAERGMW